MFPTLPCWGGGWRCLGGLEGTQPGQVTQTDPRDVPDHVTACSVWKLGAEGGRGCVFGIMVFVFQVIALQDVTVLCCRCWTPACPWKTGNWLLGVLLLVHRLLLSLLESPCLNPWILQLLPSKFSLQPLWWGSEWAAARGCGLAGVWT